MNPDDGVLPMTRVADRLAEDVQRALEAGDAGWLSWLEGRTGIMDKITDLLENQLGTVPEEVAREALDRAEPSQVDVDETDLSIGVSGADEEQCEIAQILVAGAEAALYAKGLDWFIDATGEFYWNAVRVLIEWDMEPTLVQVALSTDTASMDALQAVFDLLPRDMLKDVHARLGRLPERVRAAQAILTATIESRPPATRT